MTYLDPELSTRIRFSIGEVLPSDDVLARWVLNQARATNDILLATRRLVDGFEKETPASEHFYDIQAIASHAWELIDFLRHSERTAPEIGGFMNRLADDAIADYRTALDAFSEPLPDDPAPSFKRRLAVARNQAIHYSRLGASEPRQALARIAHQEGELQVGADFKDFYADFAADLDAQMFFPMQAGDEALLHDFSDRLLNVIGALLRFSRAALDRYLLDREELLVVEELD